MHDGLLKSRKLIHLIAALASVGGGVPQLKRVAPDLLCQNPGCLKRKTRITESVTGARYCHRCGWFERKKKSGA